MFFTDYENKFFKIKIWEKLWQWVEKFRHRKVLDAETKSFFLHAAVTANHYHKKRHT